MWLPPVNPTDEYLMAVEPSGDVGMRFWQIQDRSDSFSEAGLPFRIVSDRHRFNGGLAGECRNDRAAYLPADMGHEVSDTWLFDLIGERESTLKQAGQLRIESTKLRDGGLLVCTQTSPRAGVLSTVPLRVFSHTSWWRQALIGGGGA
jgi:hypothetical protein